MARRLAGRSTTIIGGKRTSARPVLFSLQASLMTYYEIQCRLVPISGSRGHAAKFSCEVTVMCGANPTNINPTGVVHSSRAIETFGHAGLRCI